MSIRPIVIGLAISGIGLLSTAPVAGASVTVSTRTVQVDGIYRVVSTDCYFGAGACTARFDIEQKDDVLTDPSDQYFRGRVIGDRVVIQENYPPGTSEDGWIASGRSHNGGETFAGNFHDGIGGSGTFTATRLGPG